LAHIRKWFGRSEPFEGWPAHDGLPQVFKFVDRPTPGKATLITFGLSHELLNSPSGKLREELMCVVLAAQADSALAQRIAIEAAFAQSFRRPILPDYVGSVGDTISSRPRFRAFWASAPRDFGDDFGHVDSDGAPFRIVQIVPLTPGEHDHAQEVGGHQFGHDVEGLTQSLVDLDRPSLFDPVAPDGGYRWAGLIDFDVLSDEERVSAAAISQLLRGDLAKLGFDLEPKLHPGPQSERMWVQLVDVLEDSYVGLLANTPVYLVELSEGQEVSFEARHVLDVLPNRDH